MTTNDNTFETEQTSPEPSEEQLNRARGREHIVEAWQWIRLNLGRGGAWQWVLKWLADAVEKGKVTSLRCCLDSLAESKQDFTTSEGRTPSTSHSLSGPLSRILVALRPDEYGEILEQRPSKLLDGFSSEEVLALCPFDFRKFDL